MDKEIQDLTYERKKLVEEVKAFLHDFDKGQIEPFIKDEIKK